MSKRAKVYNAEFKKAAVARMATGEMIVTALAAELKVTAKRLYKWRMAYRVWGETAFDRKKGRPLGPTAKPPGAPAGAAPPLTSTIMNADRRRIAELERQLGRKQLEVEFFRQAFAQVRGRTASNKTNGATEFTTPCSPDSRPKED